MLLEFLSDFEAFDQLVLFLLVAVAAHDLSSVAHIMVLKGFLT